MKLIIAALACAIIVSFGFVEARTVSPFIFELSEDAENYFTPESVNNGGPPELILQKSGTESFPLTIKSTTDNAVPVKFFATFGEQTGKPKLPPGIDVIIEPNSFTLDKDESVTINVQIKATSDAPDGWYFLNFVGMWNEDEFSGTNISLKVGKGSDILLSPADFIESPLKQFKSGIPLNEIRCKEGLDLAVKKSNGHPICITNETKTKLEHMGFLWPSWIGVSGEEVSENSAPFDFSLVYSFGIGGKNVLDSAQSHFLADMMCDPPIEITINLSDTEKQTIWRSVVQNDFFSFGNFTQNCDESGQCLSISPEEFTTLSVTGNGKTHTVQHRGSYLYNDNENYLKFEEITEIINDILHSRENFENLPSPRCAYQ